MPYALLALRDRLFAGLADGRLLTSDDRGDAWAEISPEGDRLDAIVALTAL